MREDKAFAGVLMMDAGANSIHTHGGDVYPYFNELKSLTLQAIRSGKRNERFLGTTWGVFWEQSRYSIISIPLFRGDRIVGGAGVAVSLENVYKSLRQTQYLLLVYIFINTIVLTLIGFHRLTKATVRPLQRLVERASEYREDEEVFFRYERTDNEFGKLSKALNRMLKQIAEDKERLKSSVMSLEKANLGLKQAQKEIIQAEKLASVGRLSSGIAHEIGNPIGIISGYMDLLKQNDIADSDKREFILRTESELNRINSIIRQLLDISKPSTLGPQQVSVHEIINDTVDAVKFQPLMSNIDLRIDLTAEKDTVRADANQLRQVFLNLLINAADAISSAKNCASGRITITSSVASQLQGDVGKLAQTLKVEFADDGPGIEDDKIDNIFDPFYTTKEPGKGTGLGLSVSFMIIDGIGGKIKATSDGEMGTTMSVYLPLV
jgi:signal transduction histidine kinase